MCDTVSYARRERRKAQEVIVSGLAATLWETLLFGSVEVRRLNQVVTSGNRDVCLSR